MEKKVRYSSARLAVKYLRYYLLAQNGKGHGVHSPFVFDFIVNVLNDKRHYYAYSDVEYLRGLLLKNNRIIETEDMGAGSVAKGDPHSSEGDPHGSEGDPHGSEGDPLGSEDDPHGSEGDPHSSEDNPHGLKNNFSDPVENHSGKPGGSKRVKRRISAIAKHAAKPPRYGQLLFRMVNYYSPSTVLELGTSLGLTTAYLAHAGAPVITMEGSAATALQALENFNALNLSNIRLLEGNFDMLLPRLLQAVGTPEFVFIDGNHRYEPTCRYFNLLAETATPATILVFDDIHWSREMEAAWKQIQAHPAVTLTIDLFFIGIVFFRSEFKERQDFVIRF